MHIIYDCKELHMIQEQDADDAMHLKNKKTYSILI